MTMNNLTGTGTALVTPFDKERKLDFKSLKTLINYQIDNGVDYIVLLGTTGEIATISSSEKDMLVDETIHILNKRLPLVVGIGGNDTNLVIENIKKINSNAGVDAILSVSPYYNKPTQEGIYQHYKSISEISEKPIILYNVPSRTSSNISAKTTLRLAHDCQNIVAIKEASGDFVQMTKILRDKPADFLVISGADELSLPIISIGGKGVISVLSNAFPNKFSQLIESAINNNFIKARLLHNKLMKAMIAIFDEGNPAGIKALLELKNICSAHVRLPLIDASSVLKNKLQKILAEVER